MIGDCMVCGPQPGDTVHTICHPHPPLRRYGCGHSLSEHTAGLRCRRCGRECGIDCGPRSVRQDDGGTGADHATVQPASLGPDAPQVQDRAEGDPSELVTVHPDQGVLW